MFKGKKSLAMAVFCAVASVGFVANVHAEELDSYKMDNIVVEDAKDVLPGGMAKTQGAVGILGDKDVMDTPFSVTNVSEKTLDNFLGSNEPLDKALVGVPSIRPSGSVLHGDFTIRGFRANGTSMYVNGIHGVMTQFNLPMFAMESVEVVSGPNSMLGASGIQYESSTAGGLINARTKRASEHDFIKYKQTFSGHSSFGEYLDVSQRFGENREWGVRLNTEILNGETSVDEAEMKAKGIAINIDHKDEHSSTNLFANYRDLDVYNAVRWFKLATPSSNPKAPGVTGLPDAPDGSKNFAAAGTHKAGYGWFATLNHEQYMNDDWTLFANFGYSRQKLNQNRSPKNSAYIIIDDAGNYDLMHTNGATPQRSYYAQIGSKNKFETGDVKHEVILSADKAWRNRNTADNTGNISLGTGNIYDGIKNQHTDGTAIGYTTRPNNKSSIWGVSLVDSMEFGKWGAMVGVHKHEIESKSWNKGTKSWKESVKSDGTCPTYSLSYKPEENILFYANHAENFDAGAEVPFNKNYENEGDILPPFKTKQDEIGVKYATNGGVYTLAYFDIDQASNIDVNVGGKKFLKQDGNVNHKGVELSFNGQIADKWHGMIGVAYMDAKYENMGLTADYKNGKRVSGQGKWSGSAALEYKADENFSVIGRATYTGTTPFYTVSSGGSANKDSIHLEAPSYMVYDLGVTYNTKINDTPVKLSAMCYNVADKDYWMVARGDQLYVSTPRTFFVSAEFEI